jgi:hypothetical protein
MCIGSPGKRSGERKGESREREGERGEGGPGR